MADGHVLLVDLDVGVGVGAAALVQQQSVADDVGLAIIGPFGHLEQAAIGGATTALAD